MTYHNFVTGERIFDYNMKDAKLREICIENMYGEADYQAVIEVEETRAAEWDFKVCMVLCGCVVCSVYVWWSALFTCTLQGFLLVSIMASIEQHFIGINTADSHPTAHYFPSHPG